MSEIDDTELREEIIRLETVVENYSAENRELREENYRLKVEQVPLATKADIEELREDVRRIIKWMSGDAWNVKGMME